MLVYNTQTHRKETFLDSLASDQLVLTQEELDYLG